MLISFLPHFAPSLFFYVFNQSPEIGLDNFHIPPRRSDSSFRFLLKGVKNTDGLLEFHRVNRPIRVTATIFNNLQNASAPETFQWFGGEGFSTPLRFFQGVEHILLHLMGKLLKRILAPAYPPYRFGCLRPVVLHGNGSSFLLVDWSLIFYKDIFPGRYLEYNIIVMNVNVRLAHPLIRKATSPYTPHPSDRIIRRLKDIYYFRPRRGACGVTPLTR